VRFASGDAPFGAVASLRKRSTAAHDALTRLEAHLAGVPRPLSRAHGDERVLYPRFRFGDRVVRTFTAIAHFGSPRHVLLDDLNG